MPAVDVHENAEVTEIAGFDRFTIEQKVTMMVNTQRTDKLDCRPARTARATSKGQHSGVT